MTGVSIPVFFDAAADPDHGHRPPHPVVPVVDFMDGAGSSSSSLSSEVTTPGSPAQPKLMLLEDIIITAPLLRPREKDPPAAPKPKRLLPRGAIVRNLEAAADTQTRRDKQNAALMRLPGMLGELNITEDDGAAVQGQPSRKRVREPAEDDALRLEHKTRKHCALPSDSAADGAAEHCARHHGSASAMQPSRAGRRADWEPLQVPITSTKPPFDVQELEDLDCSENNLLYARAECRCHSRKASLMVDAERRL